MVFLPLFTALVLGIFSVHAVNPGAQIQLDQSGIDYAKGVGLTILKEQLGNIVIPDISGDHGIYGYKVDNIKINSFNVPASQASVTVVPGKGLDVQLGGVSADIGGNYDAYLNIGITKIHKRGTVTVSATVDKATVEAVFGADSTGRPTVRAASCSANINKVDVQFHGDLFDEILDLLSGLISDQVKSALNGQICTEINSLINSNLNSVLQGIPVSEPISTPIGTYNIDYGMVNAPFIGADFLRLDLKALVTSSASPNPPVVAPPVTPFTTDPKNMFYITLTPYLVNTFGYALLKSNKLDQRITPADADKISPGIGKFLATTCPESTCIGSIVAGLGEKYPNTSVDIQTTVTTAPSMTIGSFHNIPGVFLTIAGNVKIIAENPDVDALSIDISAEAIAMDFELDNTPTGYIIKGQTHTISAELKLDNSTITGISQADLENIWKLALQILVDRQLNTLVTKGIAIPQIPYIQLANVEFKPLNNTLLAYGDIKYTGGL